MIDHKRRKLMLAMTGVIGAAASGMAAALTPTPRQSAGPFYPQILPLDDDNNLTEVAGKTGEATGIISDLSGRIVDINGRPLSNIRIEIWQCDANGRYRHPRDSGSGPLDKTSRGMDSQLPIQRACIDFELSARFHTQGVHRIYM